MRAIDSFRLSNHKMQSVFYIWFLCNMTCKESPVPSDALSDIKLLCFPCSGTIHVFLMIFKLERNIFLIVKFPGIRGTEDF